MGSGAHRYYTSLGREDYYLEGGEPPGVWMGAGAKILGLSGDVTPYKLRLLFRGYLTEKKRLVQNAGKKSRRPGWDLTFSAPKSVSVLFSQAAPREREEIRACVRRAVERTIRHIEKEILVTRAGNSADIEYKAARSVVAAFEHSTSRALDPQLHWHALFLNVGVDEYGKTRSLETKLLYKNKMILGAYFRLALAAELRKHLGLKLYRPLTAALTEHFVFQIVGVPKKLCDFFSKRRKEIDAELEARGLSSAEAAAVAALNTRPKKTEPKSRSELFETWQSIGRTFSFDARAVFPTKRLANRSLDVSEFEEAELTADASPKQDVTPKRKRSRGKEAVHDERWKEADFTHLDALDDVKLPSLDNLELPALEVEGAEIENEGAEVGNEDAEIENEEHSLDAGSPDAELLPLPELSESERREFFQAAFDYALVAITASQNHFSEAELVREVFAASTVFGLDPEYVTKEVSRSLDSRRDIFTFGPTFDQDGNELSDYRYSTKDVLDLERELLVTAGHLRLGDPLIVLPQTVAAQFMKQRTSKSRDTSTVAKKLFDALRNKFETTFTLDDEQKHAVLHTIMTPGRLKCISGVAGSGKTALLSAIAEIYERSGKEVIGATPTRAAAIELEKATRIPTKSIRHRCITSEIPGLGKTVFHHSTMLVRKAMKFPTWKLKPLKFNKKTVLVIDEAGMVSLRDMVPLMKRVQEAGGSVILVGDTRQLPSIELGGGFGMLSELIGGFHIETSRRQKEEWQRNVANNVRNGEVRKALEELAEKKAFNISQTTDEVMVKVLRDWRRAGGSKRPREHQILANTQSQVRDYNRRCQKLRKGDGRIKSTSFKLRGETFHVRDRIAFNFNSTKLGVANGETGTIIAVAPAGPLSVFWVKFDEKKLPRRFSLPEIQIAAFKSERIARKARGKKRPKEHRMSPLSLGYASTVTKAQGKTIDHVYFDASEGLATSELAYVALSRQKKTIGLYTTVARAGKELAEKAGLKIDRKLAQAAERSEQQVGEIEAQMKVQSEKTFASSLERRRR